MNKKVQNNVSEYLVGIQFKKNQTGNGGKRGSLLVAKTPLYGQQQMPNIKDKALVPSMKARANKSVDAKRGAVISSNPQRKKKKKRSTNSCLINKNLQTVRALV